MYRSMSFAAIVVGLALTNTAPVAGQEKKTGFGPRTHVVTLRLESIPNCVPCLKAKAYFDALHKEWPYFNWEYEPNSRLTGGFPQIYVLQYKEQPSGAPTLQGFVGKDHPDLKDFLPRLQDFNKKFAILVNGAEKARAESTAGKK